MKIAKRNKGVCWERVDYEFTGGRPNPEKMFQEVWDQQNKSGTGVNHGLGIAQELFIVAKKSADMFDGPDRDDQFIGMESVCVYNLTKREQRIIATVIQWLGTSCGFGFLHESLGKSGYYIGTKSQKPPEDPHKDRYELLKVNQKPKKEVKKEEIHVRRDSKGKK